MPDNLSHPLNASRFLGLHHAMRYPANFKELSCKSVGAKPKSNGQALRAGFARPIRFVPHRTQGGFGSNQALSCAVRISRPSNLSTRSPCRMRQLPTAGNLSRHAFS